MVESEETIEDKLIKKILESGFYVEVLVKSKKKAFFIKKDGSKVKPLSKADLFFDMEAVNIALTKATKAFNGASMSLNIISNLGEEEDD